MACAGAAGRWHASSAVREARKTSPGEPNSRSNFPVRREPRPGVSDSDSQSREASSSTAAVTLLFCHYSCQVAQASACGFELHAQRPSRDQPPQAVPLVLSAGEVCASTERIETAQAVCGKSGLGEPFNNPDVALGSAINHATRRLVRGAFKS